MVGADDERSADRHALVIGSSDGIGLALTRRLLEAGWRVTGISRSPSPLSVPAYVHVVCDVRDDRFRSLLGDIDAERPVGVCAYGAGIGELLDTAGLASGASAGVTDQVGTFEVNLIGAVTMMEVVGTAMLQRGSGAIVVLSSLADRGRSAAAPAYGASKAALSAYFESMGAALRARSAVTVTNVRLGFVDTKMAKGPVRPLMMRVDVAADIVLDAIARRPSRITRPRRMALLLWIIRGIQTAGTFVRGGRGWRKRAR